MSNLLDKASVILTPTAYNNGEALCVKPSDGSGDFDFSRNSAATRVNAQGLVENVQILSSNLVQNPSFSEEGVQEVSNGSFSQEGSQLITNGDFTNGTTGWSSNATLTESNNIANITTTSPATVYIRQNNVYEFGKRYKLTFTAKVDNLTEFELYVGSTNGYISTGIIPTQTTDFEEYNFYFQADTAGGMNLLLRQSMVANSSIEYSEISVREVAQDWTLGTGWSIAEDKAVLTNVGYNINCTQSNVTTIGQYYKVEFTILDYISGQIRISLGGNATSLVSANGTYVFYLQATVNNVLVLQPLDASGTNLSITNISVKEVAQNWTLGSGWSIGENLVDANLTTNAQLTQNSVFTSGKNYKVSFEILNYTSGSINLSLHSVWSQAYSANGVYTNYLTATQTLLKFESLPDSFVGSITNISVIEITEDTNLPRINYEGFSYQDALGSEEVVNGGFDNGSANWSAIRGSIQSVNDEGVFTIGGTELNSLVQSNVFTVGKKYILEFYAKSQTYNTNIFTAYLGVDSVIQEQTVSSEFQKWKYIVNPNQTNLQIGLYYNASYENIIFDNVSVKEYLGQEVVPNSGCGSWLWEPQSTNLVTDSEDYSQWTPTGVSVTSNSTTSPDGLINGTLLSTNGGNSNRYIRNYGLPTTATVKVLSIYAKANLSNFIQLFHSGDNQGYVNFDVSNGIVGTSGTKTTGEIQSVGNGWYRCIAYFDSTNVSGASSFVALITSNSAGYAGGATSDDLNVYIWGSQYEENNISSYIPTSGSTVTRNQDLCNNGGSLATINSTEGVLYAEIAALVNDLSQRYISINDGTNQNQIDIHYDVASNFISAFCRVSNSLVCNIGFATTDIKDFNKIAFKFAENDFSLWVNGVEVGTDTSGITFPIDTLNRLNFLKGSGGNFFGKTKAVAVWKEALSDSELQSLTTI